MTGKLCKVGMRPAQVMTLIGPLSAFVSPLKKWYTTSMTKYPMDIRAITLVYFNESSLLRKAKGITTILHLVSKVVITSR